MEAITRPYDDGVTTIDGTSVRVHHLAAMAEMRAIYGAGSKLMWATPNSANLWTSLLLVVIKLTGIVAALQTWRINA